MRPTVVHSFTSSISVPGVQHRLCGVRRLFPSRRFHIGPLVALPSPGHIQRRPYRHLNIWISVVHRCGLVNNPPGWRHAGGLTGMSGSRHQFVRRRQVVYRRVNNLRHARFLGDFNGYDTLVFSAISYRLVSNFTRTQQTPWDQIKALLSGSSLPAFSKTLFTDGQIYYMYVSVHLFSARRHASSLFSLVESLSYSTSRRRCWYTSLSSPLCTTACSPSRA
jgi:hypothetical protein